MDERIALIAPTPPESAELRRQIKPFPKEELKIISEGELQGKKVIFSHSGAGKVNAAHTATLMLENYNVKFMMLFGIAGAYAGNVGDVAVAETENYGEEGVLTKNGWSSMEMIAPLLKNEKEFFNTFPMDKELAKLAVNVSKDLGFNAIYGNFITVSMCSGTKASGEILRSRFNGMCENMEGAAIAHICALYKVPLLEVRGISNVIEERDKRKWNIPLAVSRCNKLVSEVVRRK